MCGGRVLAGVRASRLCPLGTGRLINRRRRHRRRAWSAVRARATTPFVVLSPRPVDDGRWLIFYYIVTVRTANIIKK